VCMSTYCVFLYPLIQTVRMITRATGERVAQGSLDKARCQGGIRSYLLDGSSKSLRRILCDNIPQPC